MRILFDLITHQIKDNYFLKSEYVTKCPYKIDLDN